MRRGKYKMGLLAGASGAVVVAAVMLSPLIYGKPKKADLVFNHRYHVEELELECVACHEGAATEEQAG